MIGLRCERCSLFYAQAAIAREMALTAGLTCRRCGGQLLPEDEDEEAGERFRRRPPVTAVRSAVHGEQLPYA